MKNCVFVDFYVNKYGKSPVYGAVFVYLVSKGVYLTIGSLALSKGEVEASATAGAPTSWPHVNILFYSPLEKS
jgi:hypothetical protein